jgi:Flp pilus assembly protein TadD
MQLSWKNLVLLCVAGVLCAWQAPQAQAGDIKVTIPRRSQLTPVQKLNREGVDALSKHQYEKAKSLFYQAYLYDPGDPFTLNNLGYISELEGQLDRAQNFYALASSIHSEAVIDRASSKGLRGEPLESALHNIRDLPMQINRANNEAVQLLAEGRAPAAESLLLQTLRLDPVNAFTLNNLGVAKESQGDFEAALRYYSEAAVSPSAESVIVTQSSGWRGKQIRELAADSAKRLRDRMRDLNSPAARAAMLNLQGVSAVNRNDLQAAIEKFSEAYKLDPYSAFSLNNAGYVSELDGDLETAEDFYRKAQKAAGANARVGLASSSKVEGMPLVAVANHSEDQVDNSIEAANEANRRKTGPIQLKRRDNSPVIDPPVPPEPQTPPEQR